MTRRSKRVDTLLRVAGIRKKQAEAHLARAELARRAAQARASETADRLATVSYLPSGTAEALEPHRQHTDLRIDAVLNANDSLNQRDEELLAARERWHLAARNEKSMGELARRERAVLATQAIRAAERATDDALRSRRNTKSATGPTGSRGGPEGEQP
ncbi:MAG: hypothetical protein ACKV2O_08220 [Acidimicrobiales bacterium]